MALDTNHHVADALHGDAPPGLQQREPEKRPGAEHMESDEVDGSDESDGSDEADGSDDGDEHQELRSLPLEDQVRAAAAWNGDRDDLDEFMRIIRDAFQDEEDAMVEALCKEMRSNVKLPPMQRAHIELWISFLPGEDSRERLDEAKWWFAHVKRSLEPYFPNGPHPNVVAGLELVDRLRKGLVAVEDEGQVTQNAPLPAFTWKKASELTKEEIGAEIPLREKLKKLDEWAKFDRESEQMRLEELRAGQPSGVETPAGQRATALAALGVKADGVDIAVEGRPAEKQDRPSHRAAQSGEAAVESAADVGGSAGGQSTTARTTDEASADEDSRAAATAETATAGAASGDKDGVDKMKLPYRNMLRRMPTRFKMRASNEAFLQAGDSGGRSLRQKKTRRDLRDMFNIGGAKDDGTEREDGSKGEGEGEGEGS